MVHEAALRAQSKKMKIDSLMSRICEESAEVRIAKVTLTFSVDIMFISLTQNALHEEESTG